VNWAYGFGVSGAADSEQDQPGLGECPKMTNHTLPIVDIGDDAEYVDWGDSIQLTGPDIDLAMPKHVAAADDEHPLVDIRPSPTRHHAVGNWIYGGPGWQEMELQPIDITPDADYNVNLDGTDYPFHFPPAYDFPLNAGVDEVVVPKTAPEGGWEVNWERIENPDGEEHTHETSFVFFAFAAFPGEGDLGPTPQYLCQPLLENDGTMIVPQEVIDDIPDACIFQSGRLTHWMNDVEMNGEHRRWDQFAIFCSISSYSKE
jgi:hypothetical protein